MNAHGLNKVSLLEVPGTLAGLWRGVASVVGASCCFRSSRAMSLQAQQNGLAVPTSSILAHEDRAAPARAEHLWPGPFCQ